MQQVMPLAQELPNRDMRSLAVLLLLLVSSAQDLAQPTLCPKPYVDALAKAAGSVKVKEEVPQVCAERELHAAAAGQ